MPDRMLRLILFFLPVHERITYDGTSRYKVFRGQKHFISFTAHAPFDRTALKSWADYFANTDLKIKSEDR